VKNFNKDFYENNYFSNGAPVPYGLKSGEITIYPVLVKDALVYDYAKTILMIDKNKINDVNILQMSDLEYLLNLCMQEEDIYSQFALIMYLCLHEEYVSIKDEKGNLLRDNGKPVIAICDKEKRLKAKITPKEFNIIKKIILFQNDKDYDDTEYSADMQEQINLWIEVQNRRSSSNHQPTMEEKKALLMSKNGMTEDKVNNLRLRLFEQMVQSVIDTDQYIGEMIIKGSYKYDVKDNIEYPIYREKKSIFERAFVDRDKLSSKLGDSAKIG
jgi:hypothetical protein